MFKVLDRVQKMEKEGKNIIHLEIGDPDFKTPGHIIEAAFKSMQAGETHYANSTGLFDLRKAVSEAFLLLKGFEPDINQVLITPGANIIIYLAIKCLVNPGEEVIVPDPGFPTYLSAAKFCQAVPVPVFQKAENIKKAITSKTRLIIINSPCNPTGSVIERELGHEPAPFRESPWVCWTAVILVFRLNGAELQEDLDAVPDAL